MICDYCNALEDCRPYGENGKMICFRCMKASPRLEAEAIRNYTNQLNAAGSEVVVGSEVGPYPLKHHIIGEKK